MSLTKTQQIIWVKARSFGAGEQAVGLTDAMCAYLVGRIALDLGLGGDFPEIPSNLQSFFGAQDLNSLIVSNVDARTTTTTQRPTTLGTLSLLTAAVGYTDGRFKLTKMQ